MGILRFDFSYPWCRGFESPSRYFLSPENLDGIEVVWAFLF